MAMDGCRVASVIILLGYTVRRSEGGGTTLDRTGRLWISSPHIIPGFFKSENCGRLIKRFEKLKGGSAAFQLLKSFMLLVCPPPFPEPDQASPQ
jgi:hypothetical protein